MVAFDVDMLTWSRMFHDGIEPEIKSILGNIIFRQGFGTFSLTH